MGSDTALHYSVLNLGVSVYDGRKVVAAASPSERETLPRGISKPPTPWDPGRPKIGWFGSSPLILVLGDRNQLERLSLASK